VDARGHLQARCRHRGRWRTGRPPGRETTLSRWLSHRLGRHCLERRTRTGPLHVQASRPMLPPVRIREILESTAAPASRSVKLGPQRCKRSKMTVGAKRWCRWRRRGAGPTASSRRSPATRDRHGARPAAVQPVLERERSTMPTNDICDVCGREITDRRWRVFLRTIGIARTPAVALRTSPFRARRATAEGRATRSRSTRSPRRSTRSPATTPARPTVRSTHWRIAAGE
jgi:hypothetical protein